MRIVLFLLLISVFQTIASVGYSQSAKITLKSEALSLVDILNRIEDQSEYRFIYDKSQIDLDKKVKVNFDGASVKNVLEELFVSKGINYQMIGNQIILENSVSEVLQQSKTVSGKVTDSSGAPLPGVSVVVKGTTQGIITDSDGNYSLANVPNDATLVFSFVGMKQQEIPTVGKSSIDVTLTEETFGIGEVVAIGYGTQNREAVTGAVAVAQLEKYRAVPVNNILETVKGTIAGLNVGATNSAGQVANMSIRGQNSTAASTSPLLVVDGAIYNGSLGDIPSADIKNFTVLKDASAAAVYGARSSNGVILIETKKGGGISGKPKFDVNLSYGISNEMQPLKTYDADGYLQRILDIRKDKGMIADPNNIADYLREIERKNYNATPNHTPTQPDPYSLIGQIGHVVNSTVSLSNSFEKTNYYISASIIDQKGVVMLDEHKQFSGRVNIDSDITDWFNLGIKSMYSLSDFSGAAVDQGFGTHLSPYASLYNEDGSYRKYPQDLASFDNFYLTIPNEDLEKYNNLNATVSGRIKIPWVKGLSYTVNYSNAIRWNYRNQFFDKDRIPGAARKGVGSRKHNSSADMLLDQIVKYNRTFAEKHNIDLTLLYSNEKNTWENLEAFAEGFDNSTLLDYALENGKIPSVNTGGGESASIGQMARATYSFDSKYSLTGTVRRDGFSAFSKNKKWGVFSSLGVNWNVGRESFMQNVNFMDKLAIRASYGSNGNQSIAPYSTLAKVGTSQYYFAGDPSYTITQSINSLALANLGWEATTGLNLGIDFGVLDNRITGYVDAYKSKTNDLLFSLSLPDASGAGSILSNIGEIQNKGIEIELHTINIVKNDFQWNSDFAFSLNRNKVVTIYGDDNDGDGVEDDLINSGYFIGRTLGTIYDYKVIGMWQQEDVDNGTIMEGLRPGDYKIEDLPDENGEVDGKITSIYDRQFLGTSKPNFRWSWTNTFTYKDISLMAYVYSIWGGNGYYQSAISPWSDAYVDNTDMNRPVYDYWTPENTGALFPRPDYRNSASYRASKYYDRSFIKLQKLALTYNLSRFVKAKGINDLRLTASADNLFTYAPHWKGLDPETGESLSRLARPSIRTFLFSLAFNF